MSQEREAPSEKVVKILTDEGLHQDSRDLNRFTDDKGTSAAQTDGDWINRGLYWEKKD